MYKYENKEKIVCACEDSTSENLELYEFESLLLSVNVDKIIDTELSDIIEIIEKLEDEEISKLNDTELRNIIYNVYSCFKINNKKIHYFEFIKSRKDDNCNEALLRVFPNIDIAKIKEFILNIEGMSNIRKNFYISVLDGRYEILESVYDKLKEASD